ncbi:unnamed protein product [Vitrella brassicaformis CCMP3155]|uniref:Uncharacterized protein n=1 Tax=Vitrella brassicaformis (strain CCMP3155) TaxID=1169540 RepID=A0A0G4H4R8_VITBC|nr:unnamed protein product [Vitrella brassicaformis CCMP3155]|eukprot:CEM38544.1 unnamed protein product [Vitrella brassicaformis CCMP3155]
MFAVDEHRADVPHGVSLSDLLSAASGFQSSHGTASERLQRLRELYQMLINLQEAGGSENNVVQDTMKAMQADPVGQGLRSCLMHAMCDTTADPEPRLLACRSAMVVALMVTLSWDFGGDSQQLLAEVGRLKEAVAAVPSADRLFVEISLFTMLTLAMQDEENNTIRDAIIGGHRDLLERAAVAAKTLEPDDLADAAIDFLTCSRSMTPWDERYRGFGEATDMILSDKQMERVAEKKRADRVFLLVPKTDHVEAFKKHATPHIKPLVSVLASSDSSLVAKGSAACVLGVMLNSSPSRWGDPAMFGPLFEYLPRAEAMKGLVSAMGSERIGWGLLSMAHALNVPRALARRGHLSVLLDSGAVPMLLGRMCDTDGELGRDRCIETIWHIAQKHTDKLVKYEALPAAVCQTLVGFLTRTPPMGEAGYRHMAADILMEIVKFKYGDEQVANGKTHSNLMADHIAQLDCFRQLKDLIDGGRLSHYTTDQDDHELVMGLVKAVASKASSSLPAAAASSGGGADRILLSS